MKIALIVIGVVVAVVFLALILDEDSLGLKVEIASDAAFSVVRITNVGDQALTIKKMTVNGRRDCTDDVIMQSFSIMLNGVFPRKLDVGDMSNTASKCAIVKVFIESDRGSETYTFN